MHRSLLVLLFLSFPHSAFSRDPDENIYRRQQVRTSIQNVLTLNITYGVIKGQSNVLLSTREDKVTAIFIDTTQKVFGFESVDYSGLWMEEFFDQKALKLPLDGQDLVKIIPLNLPWQSHNGANILFKYWNGEEYLAENLTLMIQNGDFSFSMNRQDHLERIQQAQIQLTKVKGRYSISEINFE